MRLSTAFYRIPMAGFLLLTLGLIALPSGLPISADDPMAWAVGPSLLLFNIAASGACLLALVLVMRLWQETAARWLSIFLAFTALAWALATSPEVSDAIVWAAAAERVKFVLASASLPLSATGLLLFSIHFPASLKSDDFRYWRFREEEAKPGGRFGNFLGLSSTRSKMSLPEEVSTGVKRLAYMDIGLGPFPSRRLGEFDRLESMALRPKEALQLGLVLTALVLLLSILSIAFYGLGPFFFLVLGVQALFFLRVSYAVHLGVDRQKLLWIVEGMGLSILIPLVLTHLFVFGAFFFRLGGAQSIRLVGASIGIIPIGWALGWMALVTCLAIAVFKEGVLDPRLVIKKTVFYTILTGIVVALYLALAGGVGTLVIQFAGVTDQSVTIVSTLAVAALFMPVRSRAQVWVERWFFRKEREYPLFLNAIRQETEDAVSLETMLERSASHIRKALGASPVVIFSRSRGDLTFATTVRIGTEQSLRSIDFPRSSPLIEALDEIKPTSEAELPEIENERLRQIRSVLLVPARSGNELLGFLSLGPRVRGDRYDAEDIQFLKSATVPIAAGINNWDLRAEQQDFERAREIQQRLLPTEIPQIPGYEVSGISEPARHVGGDYFDVLRLSDSKLLVSIADVVGKGMPAALLMSNVQATVKTLASEDVSPGYVCDRANRIICSNVSPGKFITFFVAILDSASSRLTYANAGHNAPILFRPDSPEQLLEAGGPVLGVFPEAHYDQGEVELFSGDRILLFTDGVTEVPGPDDDEFGERRLIDLVKNTVTPTAEDLQQTVKIRVSEFCRGNFLDDVTVVAIRVK